MTKIKICGITDKEIARICIEEGADYLGFNFVPTSKRYCGLKNAMNIISSIETVNSNKKVKYVGVFQNEKVDVINKIEKELKLDFIQLHGDEDNEYMKKINTAIIKKYNSNSIYQKYCSNSLEQYMLLDRDKQGKGNMFNLDKAKMISKKKKIFFAGGLSPENVVNIIKKVEPFAVDVAGGVEIKGKKDKERIKAFIKNVKAGGIL